MTTNTTKNADGTRRAGNYVRRDMTIAARVSRVMGRRTYRVRFPRPVVRRNQALLDAIDVTHALIAAGENKGRR